MRNAKWLASIAVACTVAGPIWAGVAGSEAGLVARPSRYLDHVSAVPGFDLRGSTKVLLQPASISFQSDWLKDMNANRIALLRRTTEQDADEIAREAARGLDASLARALRQGSFELVTEPGPGVVTLTPRVTELYVNAPRSINTQPGRTYTVNAGRAAFAIDVRDAAGRLVAQIEDERTIGERGVMDSSMRVTTPATNAFDFGTTFDNWANGTVTALKELRQGL